MQTYIYICTYVYVLGREALLPILPFVVGLSLILKEAHIKILQSYYSDINIITLMSSF